MEIHAGHRERMRRRFLEIGLDGFSDVNALELLLYYVLARQDTNPLAHALLDQFGSFKGVFEASVTDLQRVKGVGENTAILIRLVAEINRRYLLSGRSDRERLNAPEEVFSYVMPLFAYSGVERLFALCMDSDNKVLCCREVAEGDVDFVYGNPRKLIGIASETHASKLILAHNHPSGVLIPSVEDIRFTETLRDAMLVFKIQLLDHIIVGDGECLSMREHGYI